MNVEQAIRNLQQLKLDLGKIVAVELENIALDNIRKQIDILGQPLEKRKPGSVRDSGRAILVDTGRGRRSLKGRPTTNGAKLYGEDYMVAHNEGAHISGSFSVKAHTRTRKGRKENVRQHSRTVDFDLPERTFSGDSASTRARMNELVANKIVKALK